MIEESATDVSTGFKEKIEQLIELEDELKKIQCTYRERAKHHLEEYPSSDISPGWSDDVLDNRNKIFADCLDKLLMCLTIHTLDTKVFEKIYDYWMKDLQIWREIFRKEDMKMIYKELNIH